MNPEMKTCTRCGRPILKRQAEITSEYLGDELCSPCGDERLDEIEAEYQFEQDMMQAEAEAEAMAQAEAEAEAEYYEEDNGDGWY